MWMAFQSCNFTFLLCENCTHFQANMTNVIFSCPLLTKNCSCKLVVFKKIASAYQRQIALKIMLLPIQIDDMYNRKQIKRGGRRGVRLIYSIPLFMSFLSNFTRRFSSGNYATGIARRQFLHYKRAFPLPTHKTSFFH